MAAQQHTDLHREREGFGFADSRSLEQEVEAVETGGVCAVILYDNTHTDFRLPISSLLDTS